MSNTLKVTHGTRTHNIVNENYSTHHCNNQSERLQLKDFDIVLSNVTAKWTEGQTENTLQKIKLTIRPSQLVAVIGPVGAGKVNIIKLLYNYYI